jgi:hypothetical protein
VQTTLIELHYFPSIAYFSAIRNSSLVIVEKHEHFIKQTYRNRCYVNGTMGVEGLIIPLTSKHGKTKITDVKIDHSQKWLNNHWRTIQSAYGKAPFFEYYADDIHRILFQRNEYLYDLNMSLLTMCLKWLKWNLNIEESKSFEIEPESIIIDLRSAINLKQKERTAQYYTPVSYHQVFGNKFVENMSLIDLIFCKGPGAGDIVQASAGT